MLTLGSAADCALQETPELAGPREAPSPGGMRPEAPGPRACLSPLPSESLPQTFAMTQAPRMGFQCFWAEQGQFGDTCPRCVGRDLLSSWLLTRPREEPRSLHARLPVGVLPPPVGQHKVRVAEDGGQAKGPRDLPEGDSKISGQHLQDTQRRRGHVRLCCLRAASPAGGVTLLLQPQQRTFVPMGRVLGAQHRPPAPKEQVRLLALLLPSQCPPRPPARGSPW